MITFAATGSTELGVGLLISVMVPLVLVPVGSLWHISLSVRLRQANAELRRLSETDPLTHICNRRRFLEVAEHQLALARRHCFSTSLLLIDFDHFKQINDRHGHAAGDHVLVEATRLIAATLRASDTLARFGGEEFIVHLPHTAREGALTVAERIMAAVRDHTFAHGGAEIRVTLSIGGVTCETSETSLDAMTSQADSLLYESKQAGRDHCLVETLQRQGALPLRAASDS